jgi:hypothetical protein
LVQIETRWEEEVPQEVCLKEGLYEKLGLRMEDENAANAREEACDNRRCVWYQMIVMMRWFVGMSSPMIWLL